MKRYFCFHCQKEVKPYLFWKWRFCPHCKRQITDNGEGFYMVCDKCGASLPPDAKRCLKCGQALSGDKDINSYAPRWFSFNTDWFNGLVGFGALFLLIIIGLCVLYVSFYLLVFFIFLGAIMFVLNLLRVRL